MRTFRVAKESLWSAYCRTICLGCAVMALISGCSDTALAQKIQTGPRNVATQQSPKSQAVRNAAALLEAGKLEEAEVAVRGVIAHEPRNAEAHALLGVILNQRGVADEAEKELREAVRLDPRSEPAWTNLGVLLARTNRADEAITSLQRAIALAPGHSKAVYYLAVLYVDRKDYDRAIPLL